MSNQTAIHDQTGISAPQMTWGTLGATVGTYADGSLHVSGLPHGTEELLVIAIHETQSRDERAIAWALAERQRRREEQTRSTALAREAEAIGQLAAALRTANDQSVLDRILSHLSERTQYAVRQQLRGRVGTG